MSYSISGKYRIANFLRRGPRFVGFVALEGRIERCHLPNPGRTKEFLMAGVRVLLKVNEGNHYKTPYTIVAVIKEIRKERLELINLHTHVPVRWLCSEFNEKSKFAFFKNHICIQREPSFGNHRFDLLLSTIEGKEILCEIKSTTKIIDRVGFFPDAVSSRATSQLKTLYHFVQQGGKALVLFIVQSDEADRVEPDSETDPEFAKAIQQYRHKNLKHLAFTSVSFIDNPDLENVFRGKIIFELKREIPVSLNDGSRI